ncbi:site-specific integrase [Novosphingobium sp.]|uniref:tyrosine-type recombinase/integrase n=1 Tax=Novosphingobium sp. TaxID=1874826 RepID=UPI0025D6181C|nr:site-specific integrase [Novosphingobium sp.]
MPKKLSNALTHVTVKNAKPGRYADGGGLQLLVKDTGARSWVYRFMLKGRSRDIGLGPAAGPGAVSLTKARDLADDLRRLVKAGIDPLQQRDQQAADEAAATQLAAIAGITFKASAEAYIAAHESGWRNDKHRYQWTATLKSYVYPTMGDIPVRDIETSHVMAVLEPIWQAKPETARRVRGRIETVLDAAKARGHRKGENPARWRGHVDMMLPKAKRLSRGHHKALHYAEVPAFMAALRARDATAALALEFAILTAARSGEVIGATWGEVDLDAAIWTVPADRMKAGKVHRVPLSPRAVEILQASKQLDSDYLFPGATSGKLSPMAMTMLLRRMKVDATPHGFRSSFRDWAAECSSFANEVAEMALAHVVGNKVEAAYRRGDLFDKRRKLMEAWTTRCMTIDAAGENVTPIRGEAAA